MTDRSHQMPMLSQQTDLAPNETAPEKPTKRLIRPPSECTPAWFDRFIEVAREHPIAEVSTLFVRSNKITATKHEYKLIGALKFLGIVDSKGIPTSLFESLRVIGDSYAQNLRIVVEQAYGDLLETVSLKTTPPQGLYNYFISKLKFGKTQAEGASRFFVWLANESGMDLSPELNGLLQDRETKTRDQVRTPHEQRQTRPVTTRSASPSGMTAFPRASPSVQAMINITLDKDTPPEMWKLVFRLLGVEDPTESPERRPGSS